MGNDAKRYDTQASSRRVSAKKLSAIQHDFHDAAALRLRQNAALKGKARQFGAGSILRKRLSPCAPRARGQPTGRGIVSIADEIADRAIDYTNRALQMMPSYRQAAIDAVKKLREGLVGKPASEAALAKLDDYLKQLQREP
jgi:hypothetical protein